MKYKVSDINCVETFREYLKDSFPNVNYRNDEIVNKCYEVFLNTDSKRMRTKFDAISRYFKSLRCGKQSSVLSKDYWLSMGWENIEEINEKIRNEQKKRSPLCKEYYIKNGFDKSEYENIIRNIQRCSGEIMLKKYSYEDRLKKCKWSKQYWKDLGFSEEESLYEVHSRNGMCKENYNDIEEYNSIIKRHSDKQKELYARNPEKYWKNNFGYESNEEINVFKNISEKIDDIKHIHFGINVQNTILEEKFNKKYVISDGYIKIGEEIIIFEYDGAYWHDIKYDEIRDETIFLVRNDIIGVIRIGENYFKNNNIDKIIKDIKYAIKDIKSKKYKRKLLY